MAPAAYALIDQLAWSSMQGTELAPVDTAPQVGRTLDPVALLAVKCADLHFVPFTDATCARVAGEAVRTVACHILPSLRLGPRHWPAELPG